MFAVVDGLLQRPDVVAAVNAADTVEPFKPGDLSLQWMTPGETRVFVDLVAEIKLRPGRDRAPVYIAWHGTDIAL